MAHGRPPARRPTLRGARSCRRASLRAPSSRGALPVRVRLSGPPSVGQTTDDRRALSNERRATASQQTVGLRTALARWPASWPSHFRRARKRPGGPSLAPLGQPETSSGRIATQLAPRHAQFETGLSLAASGPRAHQPTNQGPIWRCLGAQVAPSSPGGRPLVRAAAGRRRMPISDAAPAEWGRRWPSEGLGLVPVARLVREFLWASCESCGPASSSEHPHLAGWPLGQLGRPKLWLARSFAGHNWLRAAQNSRLNVAPRAAVETVCGELGRVAVWQCGRPADRLSVAQMGPPTARRPQLSNGPRGAPTTQSCGQQNGHTHTHTCTHSRPVPDAHERHLSSWPLARSPPARARVGPRRAHRSAQLLVCCNGRAVHCRGAVGRSLGLARTQRTQRTCKPPVQVAPNGRSRAQSGPLVWATSSRSCSCSCSS